MRNSRLPPFGAFINLHQLSGALRPVPLRSKQTLYEPQAIFNRRLNFYRNTINHGSARPKKYK